LRGTLTAFVIIAGLLVVLSVIITGRQGTQDQPTGPPADVQPESQPESQTESQAKDPKSSDTAKTDEQVDPTAPPATPEAKATPADVTPPPDPQPTTTPSADTQADADPDLPPIPGLHVKAFAEARVPIIGSIDPNSGYKIEVDLSAWGASIMRIGLTDYHATVAGEKPYIVLDAAIDPDDKGGNARIFPFAARAIWINNEPPVSLVDARWELIEPAQWRTTYKRQPQDTNRTVSDRATYVLTIQDANNKPVVELRRIFSVAKGSYHVRCRQQIINRTDQSLQIVWQQRAQGDILQDKTSYMGDRRKITAAYFNPIEDPSRNYILTDDSWFARSDLISKTRRRGVGSARPVWPNEDLQASAELVWLASVNRYFTLVVHPDIVAKDRPVPGTVPALQDTFPSLQIEVRGRKIDDRHDPRVMAIVLSTDKIDVPAGQTAEVNVGLYAGPRHRDVFELPVSKALQLSQLIRYELGCIWCTFQPLAKGLLSFLRGIHFLVRDWAIGIIILVVVVRMILHPITKKSQVQMMSMGKHMQTLQPEIEKLKKKYKDDQQAISRETMKLYKERGINPAGMLGCLPMFLQMPIWIALYAMLFLAIELRHEPAFYGVFQLFGGWGFLGDLASPDAFIRFAAEPVRINFPLLYSLDFSTLNILPLFWAVVMYFQQKYMTPPPANEQAAQQQKMMKFMTLLFPIFLYSAPSGLTLYILASSAAGIVDSKLVRKHIKEQEEAGTLLQKKKAKPGGFMDRIGKALEARQRAMTERRGSQPPSRNVSRRKNRH